ncbi:hypothetical protein EDC04DRAFT_2606371 [Pisolithus marmoratus]|nr:hypothetical protein EDC04DRAFT_2606371 [Pisolithus marmoratus]
MATARRLMKTTIQDVLDDITSMNAPPSRRIRGLAVLEQQLALACAPNIEDDTMNVFLELQDIFECNVPSRAISWIQTVTPHIEALGSGKSSGNKEQRSAKRNSTLFVLNCTNYSRSFKASHSIMSPVKLSLVGDTLLRFVLSYPKILTALLTTSRHTPMIDHEAGVDKPVTSLSPDKSSSVAHLSSAVLDSLLCILVDSPPALRMFEEVNGVQAVVKILKRAGTPREVRIPLLLFDGRDWLAGSLSTASTSQSTPSTPTSTRPNTPSTRPRPKIFPRPPSGLSNLSFASASSSSSSSSSRLITSPSSFTSMSSLATTSIPSPIKKSYSMSAVLNDPHTPPNSPPPVTKISEGNHRGIQSCSMLMLQKDVEYEPQSPKKVQVSRLGVAQGRSASRLRDGATGNSDHCGEMSSSFHAELASNSGSKKIGSFEGVRTTDEKKEILGTMLGNVDALVEGVRKAGIWGLS